MDPYKQSNFGIKIKLLCVFIGLLLVMLIVYTLIQSKQFRIVSTNPSVSSVDTVSPFFKINFSQPLSSKNISIASTDSVAAYYAVEGKVLDITLDGPLQAGKSYTIWLDNIQDAKGVAITKKVITFVPISVAANDVPKDQQNVMIQQQSVHNPSVNNIAFSGTGSFTSDGLTVTQLADLEQAFFDFDQSAKVIKISDSSIQNGPINQNTGGFTMNFSVAIDDTTYTATIDYSGLTDIELFLYNPQTNAQVYDSGLVQAPGGD